MIPDPPPWALSATVEETRIPGEFVATIPTKLEGVAILTTEEIGDPYEFANRLTELMNGRTRPAPRDCGVSQRRIVGLYRNGHWERPDSDTPIDIIAVGL